MACDALLFLQQGAPRGFGGMGGEHRLKACCRKQFAQLFQRAVFLAQLQEGRIQSARLRMRLVALVSAAAADAMNLFGHVDDLEPARKSPDEVAGQFGGEFVEQARQFAVIVLGRLAPANRGTACRFDALVQRRTALFA